MKTDSAKQGHISHSQVSEFLRCPRKYHLHYRLGLEPEFCPSGLLFGSAVHEAIALYHQMRLEGRDASPGELLSAFGERWRREVLPVKLKPRESAASLTKVASRLLQFYVSEPRCCGEVVAVEEPFSIRLAPDIPEVWGVIDLVELSPEGRLVITDFKTAGSRSEPEREQLVLYREALRGLDYPGNGQVTARYVVLLKSREPDIAVYEPEICPADGERLRRRYAAVWRDMEAGCSFPIPGWQCADCQWQRHCDQA